MTTKLLETFNSNNQVVAFATRKQHRLTLEDVVIEMREGFKNINNRLDNIVKKNNLIE